MGPAGSRFVIHAKVSTPHSWDFRCQEGFYISPMLQYYLCYKVFMQASNVVLISNAMPQLSLKDMLLHALHAIHSTLMLNQQPPSADQLIAINAL